MSDYRTIMVPYDFSAHAEAALRIAADLGRHLGSDLHLVHVIQPPSYAYAYGTYGGAATPAIDMHAVCEGALKSLRSIADSIEVVVPGRIEPHGRTDSPTCSSAAWRSGRSGGRGVRC